MREIHVDEIKKVVKELAEKAAFELPPKVLGAVKDALADEPSEAGRSVLNQIIENAELASRERLALCQDTGLAMVFMDIGQDVHITGGDLRAAVDEAVTQVYKDEYLRKSVCHPFTRKNTGTNTPSFLHVAIVPGDKIKINFAAKGGGSENMSRLVMLKPADGREGVVREVLKTIDMAGSNPCPPVVVGVGIGGNFEMAAIMAKKAAIFRDPGDPNPDPELDALEKELLEKINGLGHGPLGLGGKTTALKVNVMMMPCHIASFPMAVNVQCHSARHKSAEI